MLAPLLAALAAFALAPAAGGPVPAPATSGAGAPSPLGPLSPVGSPAALAAEPDDATCRAAWARLSPELRLEAVEWWRAEVTAESTPAAAQLDAALRRLGRDPARLPEAPARAPLAKAAVHAPGQVERRYVDPGSPLAERTRERLLFRVPERRLRPAYRYDWASGEVLRTADPAELERRFENALAGFAPGTDLLEALVARELDSGALRAHHAAFALCYADRRGRAFEDLTLYDAWSSGADLEMPDVECLAVMHLVLDDWTSYTAPVPSARHDELYARIEELYTAAHAERALVTALARTAAAGSPVHRDGYGGHRDRLHALWTEHDGDPLALALALPDPGELGPFVERFFARCDAEPALLARGRERRRALDEASDRFRATLVRVLRELGAFEASAPPPDEPPKKPGEPGPGEPPETPAEPPPRKKDGGLRGGR